MALSQAVMVYVCTLYSAQTLETYLKIGNVIEVL
jgi:hypothetical protein